MSPSPQLEALVRAGRAERCPVGNEERLLDALGVGAPAAGGAALGSSVRLLLRWMGWMVLLGAVSVVAGVWARGAGGPRLTATPAPPLAVVERAPLQLAAVTLAGASTPEHAATTTRVPPRARTVPPSVPSTPPAIATAAVAASAVVPTDDELALVTDARLALRRHDPVLALSTLDAYEHAFPRGVFQEEAAALRVDSLVAAGRVSEAQTAANRFASTYPHSAYGPRVDALRRRMERP